MDFWWFLLISGFPPAIHEEMGVLRWLCGIRILSKDVIAVFLQTDFAGKVPNAPYHPHSGLRKPRFSSKHKVIIRISYKIPGFQLKFSGFSKVKSRMPEWVRRLPAEICLYKRGNIIHKTYFDAAIKSRKSHNLRNSWRKMSQTRKFQLRTRYFIRYPYDPRT